MEKKELFNVRTRRNVLPDNPENGTGRFPSWLHRKLPKGATLWKTQEILKEHALNTVCEEAKCPNRFECYSKKTATFLVLGKECTRSCGFCEIGFSKTPPPPQADEPERIAKSVSQMGLEHVVITMVARDDLEDGGASHLAAIIRQVRLQHPTTTIEVLTSDFHGNRAAWETVLQERPEVFNYNLETVKELTPRVRHRATYARTLELLTFAKKSGKSRYVKSGIMVGLGETEEQVHLAIQDLKRVGCDIITIGQYLQPSSRKLRVKEFIKPEVFKSYEDYGLAIGVPHMYCGPFVRSSYNADLVQKLTKPTGR